MTPILLSQLGKIVTGKTPKTSREDFFGGSTPFVTPSDMDQQRTISKTARTLSKDGVTSVKNSVIPAGAVMVSCIGSDMGKTYISGARSVTNQQINSLIVTDERASPLFIYYNLFGRRVEIREKAAGAAQPILNKTEFGKIVVDLPDIEEQNEIASILGALDDKIELNRKTAATLEEMARALHRSWFVDFDPVHARSQGLTPAHMDQPTAALFPDNFGDDGLPEGWSARKFGEIVEPKKGKSITKKTITPGDIPVVAGGLQPAYFHNKSNVSGPAITVSASGANAGFVRLYHEDIWASDCSVISREQTPHIFTIYALLSSMQDAIYSMQQGAAQPHIYPSDLKRLAVANPPSEIWEASERFMEPMFTRVAGLEKESQTLVTLRDTLLPRLMSGELRVGDAREQINEAL